MTLKRLIFLIIGCICLGLGTIGVFLLILPTVPFYLATVFCFSQSSKKLHDWFVGTGLYKKHLQSYVEKRGMLLKTKISIIAAVTLLMGTGAAIMAVKGIWIPCVIIAVVWVAHIIYFIFGVKTVTGTDGSSADDSAS
ncbi:MAG: YbaN family protein [Ruminiclostridium sp.]|nr:YbaN family protein [Ruminiclostridium sp.]